MRRLLPHPVLSVFLLVVWLLLVNSTSGGALVMGIIVALTIPPFTARFWTEQPRFVRPRVLLWLIPRVLWDIVVANMAVAKIVLTRANRDLQPAFVEIPLELSDPYGVTALASIITLTPGTVSVQLSEDRRTLHVHALDAPDPDAVVAGIKERYEGPLKELLEC